MFSKQATKSDATNPWAEGGKWIASLRLNCEVTLRELAEQTGAPSAAWLDDVEAGLRPIPSSMYARFARHLGVPTADFAAICLMHYDRHAYKALFGNVEVSALSEAA